MAGALAAQHGSGAGTNPASRVDCVVSFIGDMPVFALDNQQQLQRLLIKDVRCVPSASCARRRRLRLRGCTVVPLGSRAVRPRARTVIGTQWMDARWQWVPNRDLRKIAHWVAFLRYRKHHLGWTTSPWLVVRIFENGLAQPARGGAGVASAWRPPQKLFDLL